MFASNFASVTLYLISSVFGLNCIDPLYNFVCPRSVHPMWIFVRIKQLHEIISIHVPTTPRKGIMHANQSDIPITSRKRVLNPHRILTLTANTKKPRIKNTMRAREPCLPSRNPAHSTNLTCSSV